VPPKGWRKPRYWKATGQLVHECECGIMYTNNHTLPVVCKCGRKLVYKSPLFKRGRPIVDTFIGARRFRSYKEEKADRRQASRDRFMQRKPKSQTPRKTDPNGRSPEWNKMTDAQKRFYWANKKKGANPNA
jgi:hypothetical protein